MGEGVGKAYLEAVAHAFFDVRLEGVISGDACRSVGLGFGRVADIGDAEVDVAAFVVGHHGGTIRKAHEAAAGRYAAGIASGGVSASRGVESRIAARRSEHRIAVTVALAVDGMAGSGDAGLVEGNGDDFVAAEVSDVADGDGQISAGLPLDVEGLVQSVRELVGAVVVSKRKELGAVRNGCGIGETELRGVAAGRGP